MPYLGKSPQHGNYSKLDDFSGDFDGSDATHAIASNSIAITPVRPEALIISINGVIQEPTTDYTVSGTNITFTTAPTSGDNFFGVAMGEQLQIGTPSDATVTSAKLSGNLVTPGTLDVNGQELILDADADTSITADTDDQIDIKIAGADDFQFTANTFTAQSGSTIAAQAVTATAVTSSGVVLGPAGSVSAPAFSFSGDTDSGMYSIGADELGIAVGGSTPIHSTNRKVYINESADADTTSGLVINQTSYDDQIFALKSSDVAHGITDISETDTFGVLGKFTASEGGLKLQGLTEGIVGFNVAARVTSVSTTKSSSGRAAIELRPYLKSGTGAGNTGGNANMLLVNADGDVTGFLVDSDGDLHYDGSTAAFDEYDDALMLRTFQHEQTPDGIIKTEFDKFLKYNKKSLEKSGIIGTVDPDNPEHYHKDGTLSRPLVCLTQLQRLEVGAIVQQRAMFETLKSVVEEMLPGFADKLNERLEAQSLPALPA